MKKLRFLIFALLFLLPVFGLGTEIGYPSVPSATVPAASTTFPGYVKYLVNLTLILSGVIALAVLVRAGLLYLTSAGNLDQIEQAKRKIVAGLLGLIIILSSYLILFTINPDLVEWGLKTRKPEQGIYLIDKDGERYFISGTAEKLSYSNIVKVKFLTPSSSLMAVYLYDEENFKGNEERIIDKGSHRIDFVRIVHNVKSIYFLESKPGVYLCSAITTEDVCPTRPFYISESIDNLAKFNFDDKTDSIQIRNSSTTEYYAILFEKPGYVSDNTCPFVFNSIGDLRFSLGDTNNPPIGTSTLSSIVVFTYEKGKKLSGEVDFYEDVGCLPGALYTSTTVSSYPYTSIGFSATNPRSLKIIGPAGVVLMTKDPLVSAQTGSCQFFSPEDIDETNCVRNFPNTIYDPVDTNARPRSARVIPYFQ